MHIDNGILLGHKKDKSYYSILATAWVDLEHIMRNEVSQLAKDKYHTQNKLTDKMD